MTPVTPVYFTSVGVVDRRCVDPQRDRRVAVAAEADALTGEAVAADLERPASEIP